MLTDKLGLFETLLGQGSTRISQTYKSAATILSMLPLILLYIFTQKQFVEGIESAGITGQ